MSSQATPSGLKQTEQQHFWQPMLQKHPPKELISQKYSSDIVPQFKLILQKDKKSSNTNFLPPKIRNKDLENYASFFNAFDYLGNSYAHLINQVVFFKFNNNKYNIVPEVKHKTRVMAAFYLPYQQIYSDFQNTFTHKMGLPFPDNSTNAFFPTYKCSKGCSFDPIFWSNYQSGNLFAAIRKNPFEYDLILQNDVNSCRSVGWFNFSVQFLQEGYYTFTIKNITIDMTKIFKKGMKINYCQLNNFSSKSVKKAGEEWGLCGDNIDFKRGDILNQLKKGERYYQLSFQYRCKNKHDTVMFALDCPYGSIEAQRFYQTLMFKKVRGMTQFQRMEYGKTITGTPLSAYIIRKKKNRGQSMQITPFSSQSSLPAKERRSPNISPLSKLPIDAKNKSVIVIGRLGASDVSSSFIIQGMMDYLVDCLDYDSLKKTIDFYFFPFCNVDGAKYGNDSANVAGVNLKGDWRQVNKIFNGQIYYLKQALTKINKQNPISLVLSLVPEHQELFSSILGFKNQTDDCEDSRIFPFVLSKRNRMFSFQHSCFFQKHRNNSMCCVLGEMFSGSLVYQFNISHFERIRVQDEKNQAFKVQDEEIKQCTPESYRALGKEILSNYLQHMKLYEKNILLKDKWLKQIIQIEESLDKKKHRFSEEKTVEERFRKSFYQVPNFKETSSLFQLKSFSNIYTSKHKKKSMEINSQDELYLSVDKDKASLKRLPRGFHDLRKQKRFNDTVMETKTQIIQNPKQQQMSNSQVMIDKTISLFRIAQKKTSILKNCIPNFELQSENKDVLKKNRKDKTGKIDKQPPLKKELSNKYLKKAKIEETNKRRTSKENLDYIINNI